jgi:beta-mannosidase
MSAWLRIALYTDQEQLVGQGQVDLDLPAHGTGEWAVETVIGHFVDVGWTFRFGPPAQDTIVASLERDTDDGTELLSQAFLFPAGRPLTVEPERRLGLSAMAGIRADGTVQLAVASRRVAYGVRIHAAGFATSDDGFSVEPGGQRTIELRPLHPGASFGGAALTALNLVGQVVVGRSDPAS